MPAASVLADPLRRHVHERTDGFRDQAPTAELAGDAGWPGAPTDPATLDARRGFGGACPSALGADAPLPPAYWGTPSGLECLDRVVRDCTGASSSATTSG